MQHRKDIQHIEVLKPTSAMMSNKRGMAFIVPLLTLAGVVAVGYFAGKGMGFFGGHSDSEPLSVAKEKVTLPNGEVQVIEHDTSLMAMCGDTKATSMDFIVVNPLDEDGTPTYTSVALKVREKEGAGTLKTYTTDSDGTFAAASLSLNCGGEYVVYAPASQNTSHSAMAYFSTQRPTQDIYLEVEKFDHITVKAYDELNNADVYDDSDASGADYEDMASAGVTFKSTTNNATAYAMTTGSELEWTFRLKTATQTSWGDLKNYVVVDADASDFAKAPVVKFEGHTLPEIGLGALNEDDQGYLSGYEYVYALPSDIGETASELTLSVQSKASVNPDSDIKLRFVAESLWVDGTDVKQSIFNTAGTEVLSSTAQVITIDIS